MRLSDAQALFADTMLSPPEAVESPAPSLINLFSTPESILPERLKIYRGNIFGNLTGALLDTYPLIEKLTGDGFSKSLIRAFILENPPREACLNRYGGALAGFIESFAPAKNLPYLPDVAGLEWAMNEAYYAPNDEALTPAALQNVPIEKLADVVLPLRSSVRLMDSRWPLLAIRDFCLKENRNEAETLDLDKGGCRLMIYRSGLSAEIVPLELSEHAFLQGIQAGKPLGERLESVLKTFPGFDFQGFLQKHLGLETFSALPANT